jgi:hypothetical protein
MSAAMIGAAMLVGEVIGAFGQAPTPPAADPCRAVNDQLAQYAIAVARLQVALQHSQDETAAAKSAATPKAPVTSEKK